MKTSPLTALVVLGRMPGQFSDELAHCFMAKRMLLASLLEVVNDFALGLLGRFFVLGWQLRDLLLCL